MDESLVRLVTQFGSFGLIALIVIWDRWKGSPAMMQTFQSAHTEIVALLTKEIDDCRTERREENERDRKIRHDTNNLLQRVVTSLDERTPKSDVQTQGREKLPKPG